MNAFCIVASYFGLRDVSASSNYDMLLTFLPLFLISVNF